MNLQRNILLDCFFVTKLLPKKNRYPAKHPGNVDGVPLYYIYMCRLLDRVGGASEHVDGLKKTKNHDRFG